MLAIVLSAHFPMVLCVMRHLFNTLKPNKQKQQEKASGR